MSKDLQGLLDRMEALADKHKFDWSLKLEIGHTSMWSAELRITPNPFANGADLSIALYRTGEWRAQEIAAEILDEGFDWIKKSKTMYPNIWGSLP